jgi:hypothetical protein
MAAKQQTFQTMPGNSGKWRIRRPSTTGMSGVMLGGVIGSALGGPVGAMIGAVVGLASGEVLEHYAPTPPREPGKAE